MTSPPDDTTTDLHAVIAALRAERDAGLAREATLAEELAARDAALAQRNTEYSERIEQQTATIDVLKVMSASPGDARPVFELIVERARSFCGADHATAALLQDDLLHLQAHSGMSAAYGADYAAQFPRPVDTSTMFGRAILSRDVMQTGNLRAERDHFARQMHTADFNSIVAVPVFREGTPIGAIALGQYASGGFTDTQIELLKTFAEQAVIAITSAETYRALQERTAALATRNSEYGERIEHQAATIDVLKVMSASPGDPQPAFELIVRRARELCNSAGAGIAEYDGVLVHQRSLYGDSSGFSAEYIASFPMRPTRGSIPCRAILDKRIIHIRNMDIEPELLPIVRHLRVRSVLSIPLLRDGAAIGAFTIHANQSGGFSDSQIELLKTFAEQAVIAITSAETYRALQTRTSDLQQSLEYQTATSDMLNVISRSTFDLQPVLDTVVETAARLCDADQVAVARPEGDFWRLAANFGFPAEFEAHYRATGIMPYGPDPSVTARAVREKVPVHIHDVAAIPGYPDLPIRLGKQRTSLAVPLLREGQSIGVILLGRQRVAPFTDRQIELVRTFADQAVIAIENTRLITEQQEALERQTAMAEVLAVINAHPGELGPVFDMILEKAHILCDIGMGALLTCDAGQHRAVATRGYSPEADAHARRLRPILDNLAALAKSGAVLHHPDVSRADSPLSDDFGRTFIALTGARTYLVVPLSKEGTLLGTITAVRREVRPFTERQITLLKNFAAQAVIAMENARLITEQREALEQQTATAEVLQVINASPGNLAPVFDAMLEKAMRLCDTAYGIFATYDGDAFLNVAWRGVPPALEQREEFSGAPIRPRLGALLYPLMHGEDVVHVADIKDDEFYRSGNRQRRALVDVGGARTVLEVALRKDNTLLGAINVFRQEVHPFTDKQIALLQTFAAQAVIAIENARLITEQQDALEQQTATAEVLQVINANPGNLTPVFDAILEKAHSLIGAVIGALVLYEGPQFRAVATHGFSEQHNALVRQPHGPTPGQLELLDGRRFKHYQDLSSIESGQHDEVTRSHVENNNARTALWVPLRKDDRLLGIISVYRLEVRAFLEKEIVLLENFAAQAVIAMENARLLDEIRQRQEELRITFENMGDGVAMFDETQHLVAWNRKFQDILDVPDDIIARRQTFSEYVHYLAERGEYDPEADPEEHVRRLIEQAGQSRTYERTRPDGRVIEIRHNPVPGGGFVLIYADITERKRNETEIRAARDAAEEASRTIEAAYRELKTAQANLIQAEKMASLGQLTAGIAHEIKNPLNFVNNFAALSVDLLGELKETAAPGFAALTEKQRAEVEEVSAMLTSNLEKITEHGKRADSIVKAMLEHSRGSSGERRTVDLNGLIDEALNLAYHGARAQDQSFNITLERDFGEGIAPIEVNPQDITRVFLNIFANGFYAVTRRARSGADAGFEPTLKVISRDAGEAVEIHVRDNGTGIPADIRDKLFQPFFTTKPTGEGTGLGLSITYDIVTQQHGGSITVESTVGENSEFTIRLPRKP